VGTSAVAAAESKLFTSAIMRSTLCGNDTETDRMQRIAPPFFSAGLLYSQKSMVFWVHNFEHPTGLRRAD
jgi:hypothetical protein